MRVGYVRVSTMGQNTAKQAEYVQINILPQTAGKEGKAMTEMGFFVLGFTVRLAILVVAEAVIQTSTACAAK